MNRKYVYIILGALAILLIVVLLWWWFLRKEGTATQTTGTFGTSQNTTSGNTTTGKSGTTNVGTSLPQNGQTTAQGNTVGQTNIQLGNVGGTGANSGVSNNPTDTNTQGNVSSGGVLGVVGVPGVIWLSGSPVVTTGGVTTINPITPVVLTGTTTPPTNPTITTTGPGTVFNPTAINNIVGSNPTGSGLVPNINTNSYGQQVSNGGSGLGSSLAITAVAGALSCGASTGLSLAAQAVGTALGISTATAGQTSSTAGNATAALSVSTIDIGLNARVAAGAVSTAASIGSVQGAQNGEFQVNTFLACIARTIAKVALNQITNSVVNWINSGFNGSPSFVQNPTAFFQATADQAAGQFIQSSALSFLCSPFQLQIKIAIAQSYANRNANSCTLTQVSNNITSFMRGNFLSGNWAGMLSFTSVPTNNPYGAFLYGSIGLTGATNAATGQKQQDLAQGSGFLSFQQKQNCHTVSEDQLGGNNVGPNKSFSELPGPNQPGQPTQYQVCDWVNTTPGTVIAHSLDSTLGSTLNELDVAKSFDEIINALITQLMTRTLQGGLSNLSGAGGYASNFYSPDQLQAQSGMQGVLTQMQADSALAGQYASVQQGSISDIENAQSSLNDLYNCWSSVASSSPLAGKAVQNAAAASTTIISLNTSIDGYNNRITLANNAIITLEALQSRALSAQSTSDVSSITSAYNAAKAAGNIPTQGDVTNAQQNRTTLQSQMNSLNQQTQASLQQCNAAF